MKRLVLLLILLVGLGCEDPNGGTEPDTDADLPDLGIPIDEAAIAALFTEPSPGQADTTLEDLFIGLLDDTPAGAKVRGAFFSFSLNSVAEAMVDAHDRGVDIQIVLGNTNRAGSGQEFSSVGTLREGLGSNLTICSEESIDGACLGANIQHNKFLLISEVEEGLEHLVIQSSGNVTHFQQFQYDNLLVVSGDQGLYEAYEAYFFDLQADHRDPDYHRVATGDLPITVYFSPYSQGDPIVEDLQELRCDDGGEVFVAVAFFTDARIDIAQELRSLDDDGCDVHVLLRASDINSPGQFVWTAVRYGDINLGYFPEEEEIQLHSKYLVYRAFHADEDREVSVVWTGSHNFTRSALFENDEALLRIEDDDLFDAFRDNWWFMRDRAETRHP